VTGHAPPSCAGQAAGHYFVRDRTLPQGRQFTCRTCGDPAPHQLGQGPPDYDLNKAWQARLLSGVVADPGAPRRVDPGTAVGWPS
jgi:hypothetical protein